MCIPQMWFGLLIVFFFIYTTFTSQALHMFFWTISIVPNVSSHLNKAHYLLLLLCAHFLQMENLMKVIPWHVELIPSCFISTLRASLSSTTRELKTPSLNFWNNLLFSIKHRKFLSSQTTNKGHTYHNLKDIRSSWHCCPNVYYPWNLFLFGVV